MLSNCDLYRIWRERLKQLLEGMPYQRYRLANMVMLVVGLYKARSVYLNIIARQVPLRVQKLSIARRLRRFLANPAIRAGEIYQSTAKQLIAAASSGGMVRLIIDATKVSARHQLVMVAIAYRRRALPLAWAWVNRCRGHSTVTLQLRLLQTIWLLIPPTVAVSLVGDAEFGNARLMHQLDIWGWTYVLRQRSSLRLMPYRSVKRFQLKQFPLRPGDLVYLGRSEVTAEAYTTNLVLYWARHEQKPWLLATNLPSPHGALRLYRHRMWIEEMFGDMKGHGFDLELTRLGSPDRLSRLTLLVCLVYLWLVAMGEYVLSHDFVVEVDRRNRRDLSIFRLGWDFIARRLALDDPLPAVFVPLLAKVSGC